MTETVPSITGGKGNPEIRKAPGGEVRAGSNRIYLDGDNILHFINVGPIDGETAILSVKGMAAVMEKGISPVDFLIDLNEGGRTTRDARRILRDFTETRVKGKLAFWGLHPVTRILASFFMMMTRKDDMRFFGTREEAVKWLKASDRGEGNNGGHQNG